MLNTVKVPDKFKPVFEKAQEFVSKYFKNRIMDPTKATIKIFDERYILVRAASLSVDFFETIEEIYKEQGKDIAQDTAKQMLFDIAHATGKRDASNFHKKMDLKDPIEKLSAGPIHFAHTGWAFVNVLPESNPTPDENYYLIYDHPFSFESDTWIRMKEKTNFPVCIMNAGYSSGWCEESFGVTLVASEILCKAKGDSHCRFIMAHPSKIEKFIDQYFQEKKTISTRLKYEIPTFFKSKIIEEERSQHLDEVERRNKLMIGRETKMVEMKEEVERLKKEIEMLKSNN